MTHPRDLHLLRFAVAQTPEKPIGLRGERSGIRLSKDQRKDLLAQIERTSTRAQSPEKQLSRVEQLLADGNVTQARRLFVSIEAASRNLPSLARVRADLERAEGSEKRQANIRKTEEMLIRYIEQRKKLLAEMALSTLIELAPGHPRRQEYQLWIADLDKEAEIQLRIEQLMSEARSDLHLGELDNAAAKLDSLRAVDPHSAALDELAEEIEAAKAQQEQADGLSRLKEEIEALIESGDLAAADSEIRRLEGLRAVPKITIDFLRKRMAQESGRRKDAQEEDALMALFEGHASAGEWQQARDVAQRVGRRFPESQRASELLSRVTALESAERRKVSVRQGMETLMRFIAEGKRAEAELAFRVLQSLEVEPDQMAALEQRIRQL